MACRMAARARLSPGRVPTNQPPPGAKRRRKNNHSDTNDTHLYPATVSVTVTSDKRPHLFPNRTQRSTLARPARSTRKPIHYRVDEDRLSASDDYEEWQSTDSEEAEERRIIRSMGVIRKSLNRGSAGGVKVHCDVCSVDVTSTVWCILFNSRNERRIETEQSFRFESPVRTQLVMNMIYVCPVSVEEKQAGIMTPELIAIR